MKASLHANLVNSHVVRAVRRRGNVNDGRNYGPRYVNANNAPSNANWNYGATLTSSSIPAWPLMRHPRREGNPGEEDEEFMRILFRGWKQPKYSRWSGLVKN